MSMCPNLCNTTLEAGEATLEAVDAATRKNAAVWLFLAQYS